MVLSLPGESAELDKDGSKSRRVITKLRLIATESGWIILSHNKLWPSLHELPPSRVSWCWVTTKSGKLVLSSSLISSNLTVLADLLLFLVLSCSLNCVLVNFNTGTILVGLPLGPRLWSFEWSNYQIVCLFGSFGCKLAILIEVSSDYL